MQKKILLPHEHGAWAMFLIPFVIGAGAAGRVTLGVVAFLLVATLLFIARQPLFVALGRGADRAGNRAVRPLALRYFAICLALAGILALPVMLLEGRWGLLALGAVALLVLLVQLRLQSSRLERTIGAELLAFAGLTLTAPGAFYVATGEISWRLAVLWALAFFYAGSSIFYIKMRVLQRVAQSKAGKVQRLQTAWPCLSYQAMVLAVIVAFVSVGWASVLAAVAFIPLAVKVGLAALRPADALNLRAVGWQEVVHALVFTFLVIASYHVQPGVFLD